MVPNVIVTHPNAPEDNVDLFYLIGGIFNRFEQAEALAQQLLERIGRMRQQHAGITKRVLYLIWRKPWMSVAPGTYIDNMLRLAGCKTIIVDEEPRYPTVDDALFRTLEPDLCLLSSEPYPFREKHLEEVRGLCPASTQVQLVDGEMFSWYGSRAIQGLDYLADLADSLSRPDSTRAQSSARLN